MIYDKVRYLAMIEDLVVPMRGSDVEIRVEQEANAQVPEPVFQRNSGISYGLGNILENAVDFAEKLVIVSVSWTKETVKLRIADDGPGFDPQVIARLGEPFVTTRYGYGEAAVEDDAAHQGMGLGLFIAKTLLERSGANVVFSNQKWPLHGAEISIRWPRNAVEPASPPAKTTAPLTLPG